jgi:hypothetical protein
MDQLNRDRIEGIIEHRAMVLEGLRSKSVAHGHYCSACTDDRPCPRGQQLVRSVGIAKVRLDSVRKMLD